LPGENSRLSFRLDQRSRETRQEATRMKRISLVALVAITLGSAGCTSLCRRTPAAPVAQACVPVCPQMCPPGTVPVGGQGVTYGMPMVYGQ
jgi:hypothetical protein